MTSQGKRAGQDITRVLVISVVLYHPEPIVLINFIDSLTIACRDLAQRHGMVSHLWLIDNGAGDQPTGWEPSDIRRRLGDAVATCHVVAGHGNIGYGAGHNLAIRGAGGTFHLVTNSDLLLAPDSLSLAVAYLDHHPDVGLVSPRVDNRQGQREFTCKRSPSVFDLFLRGFAPPLLKRCFDTRLAHYERRDDSPDNPRHDIELATGAFMFFRSDVLARVDGFDERFFLYFEDFDLSKRVAATALVAYAPTVRVVHFGGHAARKGWRHRRLFITSMIRYFNKHGWKLW